MKLSQVGEFGLIDLLKRGLPTAKSVKKGIGDDCAVVEWDKTRYMLLTTDMLLEGIHFTPKDAPVAIGHKAMAVNLSDIAAMGGSAKYALVSLGLPPASPVERVKQIYQGMQRLGRRFGVSIIGGDTNRSNKLTINVALIGQVDKKHLVRRRGARPGDAIFVTGPLGDSYRSRHHLNFMPRLKEAGLLVRKYNPQAMIDISDGLIADLYHILEASGVGARLHEEVIPRRGECPLERALYDGEDFELLFAVGKSDARRLLRQRDINVFCIGEITKRKNKLEMINKRGKTVHLLNTGYRHF